MAQAQKESREIIWKAMEDAKRIRVDAELRGIKGAAKEKLEIQKIEQEYKETLNSLAQKTTKTLKEYRGAIEKEIGEITALAGSEIQKQVPLLHTEMEGAKNRIHDSLRSLEDTLKGTEKEYATFAASLEGVAREQFEKDRNILQGELKKITGELEEAVVDLKKDGKKIIESQMREEFDSARKVIQEYRDNYTAFLDNSMALLIEDATALVLQKKLSLGEHADLVLTALEEAKQKGIFSKKS